MTAPTIDLTAIPEDQRAAVAALMRRVGELEEATRRQEHLIEELKHLVHGPSGRRS